MATRNNRYRAAWICAGLALATLAVYWPVTQFDFINYDDIDYVTENRIVRQGLTWHGVAWAFQTVHAANWHPLTWLSHMLDVQIFGLQPSPHHLVNLLFHIANTILLFLLLRRMTSALWRSAFVAALFALHPLHVESVAWVAERKDVLSTFFGLLSIWAYAAYVEKSKVQSPKSEVRSPKSEVQSPKSKVMGASATQHASRSTLHAPRFYLLSLLLFAFSLMSKPTLVTLPFLLLLLDWWPLRRFQLKAQDSKLKTSLPFLREKVPFLALSLASAFITLAVQGRGGAVRSLQNLPIVDRVTNALVSYVLYLLKTFWPAHLAVFYPHPVERPWWQALTAAALLALISAGAIRARRHPFLLTGWFWFLGMLVPVIGLVQVGAQALADRYSYLPLVGIFILLVWGMAQACARWPRARIPLVALAAASVLACAAASRRQVTYWQNTTRLFQHALAVTSDNWLAHVNYGAALERQNKFDEALAHFQTGFQLETAVKINPDLASIRYDLGTALGRKGKLDDAREHLLRAIELEPDMAKAHHNLASILTLQGDLDGAITQYQETLRLDPDYAEARTNLATVQLQRRQWEVAAVRYSSGEALLKQQRTKDAVEQFHAALQFRPDWPEVLNNLAWLLATHPSREARNGVEAVPLALRACELTSGTNFWLLSTLAAAYAEAGRFPEAVTTQQKVCDLAATQGQTAQAESFQQRLALYRAGRAYHRP